MAGDVSPRRGARVCPLGRGIEMTTYRFDPVDLEQMRLLGRLPPGRRIQVMLDARELAVGLIRGRLRRQYPDLSTRELNLKVLEEIARAGRRAAPGVACPA
jgi:hypothetical protein